MDRQPKTSEVNINKRWNTAVILSLLSMTFLLYASTLRHGFIFNWDDYKYVVNNLDIRRINYANLKVVFSTYYVGNYAPLHLISYMVDYQLWGLNPAGYHFGNILLHALNGLLVYRLFLKLELPTVPALFGAALFVLHPVQVESVAWVSERKNVLSALFFLLALLSYIDYKKADAGGARNYFFSLTFFTLALLTKSAAVVFPFVIACYDFCYCRMTRPFVFVDKLAFMLLALATGFLAVLSQNRATGIDLSTLRTVLFTSNGDYPGGTPLTTIWTMAPVFLSYLKDLVYPFDLSPYYIVPIRKTIGVGVAISISILLCLSVAGVMSIKRWPRLLFFITVYTLSLLPVMQIIPLLSTLKNDRYLYFPMIGAAGVAALLMSALMQRSNRLRSITVTISVIVCITLGSTAYYQSLIWKDNITLWQSALKQNPDNILAWLMLAKGYTKLGNSRDAIMAINAHEKLKSKDGPLRGWEGEW